MAVVLASRESQALLRDLLRDSPRVEHKVSLREVLAAGSAANLIELFDGAASGGLRRWVAALPDLDVYFPDRSQRETWVPGRPVAVVAYFNRDVAPTAWLADGTSRTVTDIVALRREAAILLITGREGYANRQDASRVYAGNSIQSPSESDHGVVFLKVGLLGDTTIVHPISNGTSNVIVCETDCGGGLGSAPVLWQRVEQIVVGDLDDGIFSDAVELEWRAKDKRLPPQQDRFLNEWGSCREEGILRNQTYTGLCWLYQGSAALGDEVDSRDTDGWPDADDYYSTFADLGPPTGRLWNFPNVFATTNGLTRQTWTMSGPRTGTFVARYTVRFGEALR